MVSKREVFDSTLAIAIFVDYCSCVGPYYEHFAFGTHVEGLSGYIE